MLGSQILIRQWLTLDGMIYLPDFGYLMLLGLTRWALPKNKGSL